MADLTRAFDWSRSPLGPVETWSDTLVTTVNLLLASRHPMFLWWGDDLIQFYNDGYRPSIRADKHPSAVGQPGRECWPEIWPIIGPQIEAVMTKGQSSWNSNQLVPINRNGKLEEVYWTYSYSPVRDKHGIVHGTLVVCSETTEQVLSERRLRTLLSITPDSFAQSRFPESDALPHLVRAVVHKLGDNAADIPFAVLYVLFASQVTTAASTSSASAVDDPRHWQLPQALDSHSPFLLKDVHRRLGDLVFPPCLEPVTQSYVLPLALPGSSLQSVLVFGISPRLPFDDRYRTFFDVVGARIAALLQAEVQRLELAQATQRFSTLVEANPFGMIIAGFHGEIKYVNPSFLEALGYSEPDVRSGCLRWDRITPPEHVEADSRAIDQLRASGRCDVYEKAYIAKNGSRIPILVGASVIEHLGRDPEIAMFVTDLSSLKEAQEALRKANDDLEQKVAQRTAALETEVSDRKRAEMSLRELTGRLLRTQDEERRRLARELHDSAGQTLALLAMNLSALRKAADHDHNVARLTSQIQEISDHLSREIRTLSYLLHPPLLDEVGLQSALRWYADGFAERSKIKVDLELPSEFDRLPRELELVIFRIVQESLTNIHRHSGSDSARIYLSRSDGIVEVEISDRGKGISPEKQREMAGAKAGVGVRGMEERVRQFGGSLRIHSDGQGTKVLVTLPLNRI